MRILKKIDAHIHVNKNEYFDQIAKDSGYENTTDSLKAAFDKMSVEHAIVMGNSDISLESHNYPDFLSYCIGLDSNYLKEATLEEAVPLVEKHLKRENCVGIKLYPGYSPYYVSDPLYAPYFEMAGIYKKTVAIHTGVTAGRMGRLKYSHPLTIDDVAGDYPDTKIVMCHLGNPWIADAVTVIGKNDNVFADLSGLLEGRVNIPSLIKSTGGYLEFLRTWISYLGDYKRLMYGTDWPLVNLRDYEEFIKYLIPDEHMEDVFYNNAVEIYNLKLNK